MMSMLDHLNLHAQLREGMFHQINRISDVIVVSRERQRDRDNEREREGEGSRGRGRELERGEQYLDF